jgi:hypothetical protein
VVFVLRWRSAGVDRCGDSEAEGQHLDFGVEEKGQNRGGLGEWFSGRVLAQHAYGTGFHPQHCKKTDNRTWLSTFQGPGSTPSNKIEPSDCDCGVCLPNEAATSPSERMVGIPAKDETEAR